jgi:hypothetical protein
VKHPAVKKSIDKLLNDASGGEHSEVVMLLNERILARIDEEKTKMSVPVALQESVQGQDLPRMEGSEIISAEALARLKELSNDGIDTSFLDALSPELLKPVVVPRPETSPEDLLSLNGEVLHQLYLEQTKRLATAPTLHLGNIPAPGETECVLGMYFGVFLRSEGVTGLCLPLADDAVATLSKLIGMTKPGDVVPAAGVRKALNLA